MGEAHQKPSPPASNQAPQERFDSWKEIAAYLKRDVRTVQRWEKLEGLPVHRHLHSHKGTVYAYRSQLDAWWSHRASHLGDEKKVKPLVTAPAIVAFVVLLVLAGVLFAWWYAGRGAGQAARTRPINPEAYEAYLKALHYAELGPEESLRKRLSYFEQAVEKDPAFPLAYLGIAQVYYRLADSHFLPEKEAFFKGKLAVAKALELDGSLIEGHLRLAYFKCSLDLDWSGAEGEYQRALEVNPNSGWAHLNHAYLLSRLGRHEEALAEVRRAEELGFVSTFGGEGGSTWVYLMARNYDEVIQGSQKEPNSGDWMLGLAYTQKGMFGEAYRELRKAQDLGGGSPLPLAGLGYAYAASGRPTEALKVLEQLKDRRAKGGYVSAYDIAVVYAGLRENDETFEWLEKAHEECAAGRTWLKVDPRLDSIRPDPRYRELLRRMNFPM